MVVWIANCKVDKSEEKQSKQKSANNDFAIFDFAKSRKLDFEINPKT